MNSMATRTKTTRRKLLDMLITAAFALAFTATLILAHHWSYN